MTLPVLVFASPEGGTIHKYELSGGKKEFMRFISCYLGECKFHENIEDAEKHLNQVRPYLKKK